MAPPDRAGHFTPAATVGVIGGGTVGQAALESLSGHGALALRVAEPRTTQPSAAARWGPTGAPAQPSPVVTRDSWAPWLAECDVCLLCADVIDVELALELNAQCLESGVPLLPGLVMGTVAQVGPLITAGRSACLRCVDLRLRATTGRTCLGNFGPPDDRLSRMVGHELALRALRLIEGGDEALRRTLRHQWADGSSQDHPVLRTWHCEHCGHRGPSTALARPNASPITERRSPDPARILSLARDLVDPVTGLIRALQPAAVDPAEPSVKHWMATLSDPGWAAHGQSSVYCGGNSLDDERARAAALGEAVERMAACQPLAAAPLVAPYRDVRREAIDPAAWELFDPATRSRPGFPYAKVTHEDAISWTWGWSLLQGRAVLVPTSRVFAPFRPRTPADWSDHPPLGGGAAGTTMVDAVLGATLEILERDAFMIAWANRLVLSRLAVSRSSPGELGHYVAAFLDRGVEVRCALLVLDHGVPVVIAIARSARDGDPATTVAAAAGLEWREACQHALAELSANRLYVKGLIAGARRLPACHPDDVHDQPSHGLLYARADMTPYVDHWWNGPMATAQTSLRPPGTAKERLGLLLDRLAAAKLEVIVVDVTPPEVGELGLVVARVLIPGTYPMNFDSRWPHFGGARLRSAPVAAGLLDAPTPFEALNRVPHPFP